MTQTDRFALIGGIGTGLVWVAIGASQLAPIAARHWGDPAVRVLSSGTLLTYAREILVETDTVDRGHTLAVWMGLLLIVLGCIGLAATTGVFD